MTPVLLVLLVLSSGAKKCITTCHRSEPPRCYYELADTCLHGECISGKNMLCEPVVKPLGPWNPRPSPEEWSPYVPPTNRRNPDYRW